MFFKKRLLLEIEFAEKFAKQLNEKYDDLKVVSINDLEIKCDFRGIDRQYFLDNAYSEYIREPKSIKLIMKKYLNSAFEMFLPETIVNIDRVFPIVKDRRFLDSLEKLNPDFEKKHIFEFYNYELIIFYAEDKEYSIQYISAENLEEINFPLNRLKEKAIENLEDDLKIERHGGDGYFMLTAGGNYESSLILLNIWNHENFLVDGNLVVGIPSRDVLLITGSKDSENLHRLYDSVHDINETGDHIVSDKIFEFKDGKFEVLR